MAHPGTLPAPALGGGGGGSSSVHIATVIFPNGGGSSMFLSMYQPPPVIDPRITAMKAEIKPGEILAYRFWRGLSPGVIHSMSMPNSWGYTTPMTGNPETYDEGVYAFKNPGLADTYIDRRQLHDGNSGWPLLIFGEVLLWGLVIEHNLGYRAQYAKPKSFLQAWGPNKHLLPDLKKAYGV